MCVRATLVSLASSLLLISCGGGGGSSSNTPTSPSPGGSGSTTVTINIIGDRGAQSFSPNPATVPAGQMVIWRNTDSMVHRVVIEGVVDTGDINPGASSAAQPLGAVAKGYHCLVHPGMVGALNGASNPDPCDDYGYGCR